MPTNEAEFEGTRLQLNFHRARGGRDDSRDRMGGIHNPQKSRIPAGQTIYRLGNAAKPPELDQSGAWWMLDSTLALNAERASDLPSFIGIIRQNLAVPPSFSPLNRLLRAVVRQRLTAFAGIGAAVWKDELAASDQVGAPRLWAAGVEMGARTGRDVSLRYQLFVPGLRDCGATALQFLPTLTVAEWFGAQGRTV